jgi:hypothetical protein
MESRAERPLSVRPTCVSFHESGTARLAKRPPQLAGSFPSGERKSGKTRAIRFVFFLRSDPMKKYLMMLAVAFALGMTVGCGGSSSTAPAPKPSEKKADDKKADDKKAEEPKKEEPKKEEPKKEEPKKEEPKKEEKK